MENHFRDYITIAVILRNEVTKDLLLSNEILRIAQDDRVMDHSANFSNLFRSVSSTAPRVRCTMPSLWK